MRASPCLASLILASVSVLLTAQSPGTEAFEVVSVKPNKAGIIRVRITNKKACNTQRIGIVGVYEPPVTG